MNFVQRKLSFITTIIVLTSILGILSVLEVRRGVGLHESNIQHLGLTSQLKDSVYKFETPGHSASDVRAQLAIIRLEPQHCLDSLNPALELGLKVLGTQEIVEICKNDFLLLNEGLVLLDNYEDSTITRTEFKEQFESITNQLHGHSLAFRPLVSKTVNVLLLIAGLIIALKGILVTIITINSSKSILKHYNKAVAMEMEVRVKNDALNESITTLENQKLEITRAHESAEHNAMHDSLTTLPNRRYLDFFLENNLSKFSEITIFHIDMDGFKQINDTKGHHAGDSVLIETAKRLSAISTDNNLVARIGGDEFILASFTRIGDKLTVTAEELASNIVHSLGQPIKYDNNDCRVSASVGVAVHNLTINTELEDYSSLLINSDLALYRSKLNGRNGYAFYDAELHEQLNHKKQLAEQILLGLENNEFIPYFQLQVEAGSHTPSGVEALARWQHPTKGLLFPDQFLPLAEEMGVLAQIDQQIFNQALACFNNWKYIGINVPKLSVNVSLKRLLESDLIEQVKQREFTRGELSFEILESVLLDNADIKIQSAINSLKEIGVELELDDFGSGHASILGLMELRPSRFKIDRQLIQNIETNESQAALVRSIIGMGKTLDLEVIAEGVECIEQANILDTMGCNMLQGYYFSKPVSNESFIELVSSQNLDKAA